MSARSNSVRLVNGMQSKFVTQKQKGLTHVKLMEHLRDKDAIEKAYT